MNEQALREALEQLPKLAQIWDGKGGVKTLIDRDAVLAALAANPPEQAHEPKYGWKFGDVAQPATEKQREDYPGQAFFHEHNANIAATEHRADSKETSAPSAETFDAQKWLIERFPNFYERVSRDDYLLATAICVASSAYREGEWEGQHGQ